MSIEAGAKAGMVAPDETTFEYLAGRSHAPTGADWEAAVADWRSLVTDQGAAFDRSVTIDGTSLRPHVTWGTNPAHVIPIDSAVPGPGDFDDPVEATTAQRALDYMGLTAGTRLSDVGSRHGLHRELHEFAHRRPACGLRRWHGVARWPTAFARWSCPGSFAVKTQAEA